MVPGAAGVRTAFLFRVRSSNRAEGDPASQLRDPNQLSGGLTSGSYVLQVRLREQGEVPGSTVRYADIRYATNGIETYGLPGHSPLLGEAAEDNVNNNNFVRSNAVVSPVPENRPQDLGNLLTSDRAVQSIAGSLSSGADVDFYQFTVQHTMVSDPSPQHAALTFDMDYADGLSRPDTSLTVFDATGTPILTGLDSNIAEDQRLPVANSQDPSGLKDLSRGSAGKLDPFIGTVEMPEGTYFVAVTSNQSIQEQIPEYIPATPGGLATQLNPAFNPLLRREPIDSVVRIAEDHIDPAGARFTGSTAAGPVVPVLLDPAFVGTTTSPANLWHVSSREAAVPGHGVNTAFDRSRINAAGVGQVNQALGNKTIATAQTLESVVWSLAANPNIGGLGTDTSNSLPHVSITNDPTNAGGTFNYYSFLVPHAGARGIFDIDGVPAVGTAGNFDSILFLYDTAGNLLASNDNLPGLIADAGSNQPTDALLDFTFPAAGAYVIGVARHGSVGSPGGITGVPLQTGDTYLLHVSVQDHPAVTTVPVNGGQTFYFGREGVGNYDIGQRATGSLKSNEFSLQGYSAADKPVLYFNYFLETDSRGAGPDAFRVYVGDAAGNEALLGSSLVAETGPDVKRLSDAGAWRQIRLSLDAFAGKGQVHVRFAFDSGDANNSPFAEGVHIDDVIIGFAEHGEMLTGATASNPTVPSSPFVNNPEFVTGATVSGSYQLEIRRSTEYGTTINNATGAPLILQHSFDTNDRLAQQVTLVAPSGYKLTDGQSFAISDGLNTVTLEYNNTSLVGGGGGVRLGNARVDFVPADADYVIARRIRDVINSPSVQGVLHVQAANADGTASGTASTDNRINLFGNAEINFTPVPQGTVALTGSTTTANDLRDRLLGAGITPLPGPSGNAVFIGGVNTTSGVFTSAGFFTGGAASIGIDSGVILATGDATVANGPNTLENASGVASGLGDTTLNTLLGVTTRDTSTLEFPFHFVGGTLYFNFVFASEEYNELVGAAGPDAFAILVTDLTTSTVRNLAVVPGTTTPISRNTVNGGNPLGTGAVNTRYYRNNSLANGGKYVDNFGYDGFTDVFTAQTALPAGNYKVKFAISDVGGLTGDSALLIQASSNHPVKLGQSHSGPVRNLAQLNDATTVGALGGMAPGATIVNNTISGEGLGGIHFSGNLTPYELTTRRPAAFPSQITPDLTAGDAVCDGDRFGVTAYGTSVVFEFEDISGSTPLACGSGVLGGNGWTAGNIPIFYRRTHESAALYAAYHPIINPASALRFIGYTQQEMAIAIGDAIRGSILVSNDSTLVADAILGPSRSISGNTLLGIATQGDPAVFVEHASQVFGLGPPTGLANIRQLPLATANQPFGRIVNNTIYGHDGTSSFTTSGPVTTEPNDTIFSAVDTKQGRAQNPEVYASNGVIGDRPSIAQDVDFFQFQMGIGNRLILRVAGTAATNPLNPYLRLFNEIGEELTPTTYTPTNNGATVDVVFDAIKSGSYYVGVSGKGNDVYSPLSLGERNSGSTGAYSINLNVLAPHDYVITVGDSTTYAAGSSFRIQDVTGNWVTYTFGGNLNYNNTPIGTATRGPGYRHPEMSKLFERVLGQGLNGVSAEALGGLSQGLNAKAHIDVNIRANFERYVIVRGAARMEDINSGIAFSPQGVGGNLDELLPERGILISEQSSPTLLNNVLVNNGIGVQQTGRAPFTAIEGASIYQYNANNNNSNVAVVGSDFNIQVPVGAPFFVNAADGNFYPAPLSRAIDSSVDSLEDRPLYISVKAPMGISNSPILAPDRDATGQLRVDDPNVSPPQGQGANVFKDRGSLDRSDFKGPHAELVRPLDNDGAGIDQDPTTTVVELTSGVYPDFRIQIVDGFEAADPFPGVGVNDATVLGPTDPNGRADRLPGAVLTLFENGRFLQEQVDYT
ncbi:MAG: choice-of-anchor L domain-containing protein, partial [Planctomycetota bacterium]|nr:choice-of-anchor L domain-containing protein [Planctomycetota bacterium]